MKYLMLHIVGIIVVAALALGLFGVITGNNTFVLSVLFLGILMMFFAYLHADDMLSFDKRLIKDEEDRKKWSAWMRSPVFKFLFVCVDLDGGRIDFRGMACFYAGVGSGRHCLG